MEKQIILQFRCDDRPGILARVTPFLTALGCDIRESSVYGDASTSTFFVRMRVATQTQDRDSLAAAFTALGQEMSLEWSMLDQAESMKVLIAVSKFDHCFNDLLHKWKIGVLPIEIVGVVSNHADLQEEAERYGLEFHHLPITKETKPAQEEAFKKVIERSGAELIVLARYMQILSDDFSSYLSGRCINIHHSFLPSFKGARPYHQAFDRGVKLIGATAHYVTSDLDEGPIIEQDVRRVTHATKPEEMIVIGHETESSVLSRAVKWHAERRVFLNGNKTVVLL